MQYKEVAGGICAPKGFAAAGVHCGIRANHSEKYDLALIKAEVRWLQRQWDVFMDLPLNRSKQESKTLKLSAVALK